MKLGKSFIKRYQMNEAVKNLESALEQAETVYHEKPHIILAEIRNELGVALMKDSRQNLDESLLHLEKAKEIVDHILGPNQPVHADSVASLILYNMGTNYYHRGDLAKAFHLFKDALNMNSESCGENGSYDGIAWGHMGSLCSNFSPYCGGTGQL